MPAEPHIKPPPIYVLPSEALDMDSLACCLLFAEIWQAMPRQLPFPTLSNSNYTTRLQNLRQQFPTQPLHCLLPLAKEEELLWRKDISYLLGHLGERLGNHLERPHLCSDESLHYIFANAGQPFAQLEFSLTCPAEEAALVLLDRHHLPSDWPQTVNVLAIWDHRPDGHTLPQVPLRCVQPATSCVALLLDCAINLGLFSHLSAGTLLLALSALHLESRQNPNSEANRAENRDSSGTPTLQFEQFWEQTIWQKLQAQLVAKQLGMPQQRQLLHAIAQQRDNPDGDLFQLANCDVKVAEFLQIAKNKEKDKKIRIAVAVVPASLQTLQALYAIGELDSLVHRCLQRQRAEFLIVLHRQSPQNPQRAVSFCFGQVHKNNSTCNPACTLWQWNRQKVDFFLQSLAQQYPGHCVFPQANPKQNHPKGQTELPPELVQWQQQDQNMSRKAFMPALRQSFTELLKLYKEL